MTSTGTLPKKNNKRVKKNTYYSVHKGFKPGIYLTWEECEEQVANFSNPQYKKCSSQKEANDFMKYGIFGPPVLSENHEIENIVILNKGSRVGVYFGQNNKRNFLFNSVLSTSRYHSILGVLRSLDCIDNFEEKNIIIHVPTLSVYNVLTRYIYNWRDQNWYKSDNTPVQEAILLQTLLEVLHDKIKICYQRPEHRAGWVLNGYTWFSSAIQKSE